MEAELRQEWVDALRSGDFEQGKSSLRCKEGCYCCLGVLGCCMGIAKDVLDTYGSLSFFMDDEDMPISEEHESVLVTMNDEDGDDFESIAAWIESNIPINGETVALGDKP